MSFTDEIQRLHDLHKAGALTDAEFEAAKAKLIAAIGSEEPCSNPNPSLDRINKFRRSVSDRWLAGVCGGLGTATGIESWIWRLLFVLFTFYFGFGFVAYVLAWIFVPEQERQ